ncbi:MAG: GNAT family N-acetyltransferase [Acidimicrobiia bacterium]
MSQAEIDIRALKPDQADDYRRVLARNFGVDPRPEAAEGFARIWEPERSFCAFDRDELVGTSGAFSLQLTVPGGIIATAGTTMVSVAPTHRRRGVLRRMLQAHFRDASDRGEPLVALWASEASIYGRFGYGVAAQAVDIAVPKQYTNFHRLAPQPAPVRLVEADEARALIPPIFDKAAPRWPGFFARSDAWWDERWFKDPADRRSGASSLRFALTTQGDGFAIYRQKHLWEDGNSAGEIQVVDLLGTSPESWAGLWSFILNHDLAVTIKAERRSPIDPLFDLLANPRQTRQWPRDSIWVRTQDPAKALAGRRYQVEGHLVLEVVDPFLEQTTVVELEGGPDGAVCQPTSKNPDLVMDSEDLGACYLGWSRFRTLSRSGRVGGDSQSLTLADVMFGWDPQPWCPETF